MLKIEVFCYLFNHIICFNRYADNCPLEKIASRLGLGFESRLGLVLGLGGNRTIALLENCPPFRVSFGGGCQFSSGAIVLEPFHHINCNKMFLDF